MQFSDEKVRIVVYYRFTEEESPKVKYIFTKWWEYDTIYVGKVPILPASIIPHEGHYVAMR